MLGDMGKPRRRTSQKARQARAIPRSQRPVDAASSTQPHAQPSGGQILEQLGRARSARDAAEAELDAIVDRAVGLGIGWPEIAVRLGVTRQAARQRYQRRHGSV